MSSEKQTITFPPLYPHQRDVLLAVEDSQKEGGKVVVVSKRQVGKSLTASLLLIKVCLERKGVAVIIEPTLNQSRKVFKDIYNFMIESGTILSANKQTLEIEWVNGSQLLFRSAEQGDNLRGITVTLLLVFDEASFIPDEVFEILYPTVDVYRCPILFISTPLFRDGEFYRQYINPNNITFNWSDYDLTDFLSQERLEEYRQTMTPMRFKSEILGEFIDDGGTVFENFGQCIKTDKFRTNPIYCGVDFSIGKMDGDKTVLTLMDENKNVTDVFQYSETPDTQISYISGLINSLPSLKKVYLERNGIGDVYYDMIRKNVIRKEILTPFTTSNDSKRKIIESLNSAFNNKSLSIPNNRELIKQLTHFSVHKTPTGKITYEGLGAHDDYVMSLALCYEASNTNHSNYNITITNRL